MKTLKKLPEKMGGGYVDVEWEIGDRYDSAGDGYCFYHFATGISAQGHMFSGSACVVSGECSDIEDIEFIGMQQWLPEKDK